MRRLVHFGLLAIATPGCQNAEALTKEELFDTLRARHEKETTGDIICASNEQGKCEAVLARAR